MKLAATKWLLGLQESEQLAMPFSANNGSGSYRVDVLHRRNEPVCPGSTMEPSEQVEREC